MIRTRLYRVWSRLYPYTDDAVLHGTYGYWSVPRDSIDRFHRLDKKFCAIENADEIVHCYHVKGIEAQVYVETIEVDLGTDTYTIAESDPPK
jgi:hypothetical protein